MLHCIVSINFYQIPAPRQTPGAVLQSSTSYPMYETVLPRLGNGPTDGRAPALPRQDDDSATLASRDPSCTRVTQLDVAKAAGVHNTTVSLALRNHPTIPLATRERIQALARSLGYRPDPALQALASYRKSRAGTHKVERIAYLTGHRSRWGWRKAKREEQHFEGARRRAAERGYELEHFWLREPGMTPHRMSQVLFNRGITGVILAAPDAEESGVCNLEWELFSAVRIGPPFGALALNSVTSDCEGSLRLALKEVLAAGYKRLGLIVPRSRDEDDNGAWSFGFMTEQLRLSLNPKIPVLFLSSFVDASDPKEGLRGKVDALAEFAAWHEQYRPEVVLGFRPFVPGILSSFELRSPGDLAFVDLSGESFDSVFAAVRQNCESVGAVAFDLLANQLQQNQRGLPSLATVTYVTGTWRDGGSLPFRGEPSATEAAL